MQQLYDSYNGNNNVKRDGVVQEWTKELVQEYARVSKDPVYFAEKYCKVISLDRGLVPFELYPYQKKMFEQFNEHRFNIVLACRQSGKCCHPDTLINVCFLGEHSENIKIKTLFEIFTSINNYRLKYYGNNDYVFRKQIHKDILFDNREAEEVFARYWRSSSYNSKKLWWDRLFGKSSKVELEGTLSLSSIIDKDVPGKVGREVFDAESVSHDVSYEKRYSSEEFENVSIPDGRMARNSLGEYDWGEQSVLWEEAQSSSKGVSREKTGSNPTRQNIQFVEGTMEGSGISSENGISVYGRDERENVEISPKQTSFGTTQAIYKGFYEYTEDERTYVENSFRQNAFREAQEEVIGINGGQGNDQRTCFENIGILERQSEVGRTQEEVIRIGEETSQENLGMSSLSENWKRSNDVSISFQQLQETEKFVESYEGFGFTVESDTGFEELYQVHKTIKFDQYVLKTSDEFELICADNHIVFDEFYNEKFVKDLKIGTKIQTKNGLSKVSSVVCKGNPIHMYDIGVNHDNHRFFSSGILSHNSISACAYLLWFALFHSEKTVAVLANKGATAREMLARITLMLENIPFFLQPGCKALNKGSIEFSNNSRILAAATSGSSIRGLSVNLLYLDEFAFVERANEFYTSTYPVVSSGKDTKIIVTSTANGIGNTFYKIWEGAVQGINEFSPFRVDWWDVPGRDDEWKIQTIANTSQLQFDQEFGNCLKNYSQITICINNIIYDIQIGDLYDAINTRGKCGLPVEEEIRLRAIRWYHAEEKTQTENGGS